jgi:hypothetical protein
MTNYRNATVIRLFGINDASEIESDNQYQMGTISREVGPKVRIVWDGQSDAEYAFKANLAKSDNMFVLRNSDKSVETDIVPITDILPIARESYIADKADNEDKADNADKLPYVGMTDESDKQLNPDSSDDQHASVEMLEAALSAGEQAETDMNDKSSDWDNTDDAPKPVKSTPKPRTRRTTTSASK